MSYAFLSGVGYKTGPYANWTSHNIWAIYQLTFAIITPALTIGAVAERMKFNAVMLFSVLWMFAVYFPATHMMWSKDGVFSGLLNEHAQVKAIDFAGGIVVHMTSGWSALLLCILLGKRRGFGREPMPRIQWFFAWLERECFGWAGTDSTPVPLGPPTASQPSIPQKLQRSSHPPQTRTSAKPS
jgi:ammonia channel protein AmtB